MSVTPWSGTTSTRVVAVDALLLCQDRLVLEQAGELVDGDVTRLGGVLQLGLLLVAGVVGQVEPAVLALGALQVGEVPAGRPPHVVVVLWKRKNTRLEAGSAPTGM